MSVHRPQARDLLELGKYGDRMAPLLAALPKLARVRSLTELLRRPEGGRWTRPALAEKTGLKPWRVESILGARGRVVNLIELCMLAKALGCSLDALAVALAMAFYIRCRRLAKAPLLLSRHPERGPAPDPASARYRGPSR